VAEEPLVVKEMGLTVDEFLRGLPGLAGGSPWGHEKGRVRLQMPDGEVSMRLQPLPDRRLAALAIPVIRVEIDLSALPVPARETFLARFDLHYRRGGG